MSPSLNNGGKDADILLQKSKVLKRVQPMPFIAEVHLYSDGACRGNPGPGAIGIIVFDSSGNVLYKHSECIGKTTNNRAEYHALIKGLDLCAKFTRRKVVCHSDSQIVVNQMNGDYRLKNDQLRKLFHEVREKMDAFEEIVFQHVPRTHQRLQKADRLANEAFEGRAVSVGHST